MWETMGLGPKSSKSESEWLRDLQISLLRKRSSYGMALKKTGRARRMELKSTGSGRTYDT